MGLSDHFYDVIVVGSGPAGSYAACNLASSGHRVAVFEEKSESGLDVCCTGIVSIECFHSLGLDTDAILTGVKSAKLVSPSGKCLTVQSPKVQAYVIDRPALDRTLTARAQSRGAKYFFSSRITDIIPGKDIIQAETLRAGSRQVFTARSVVLANGFRPKLSQKLGMGRMKAFLGGAQAEVEATGVDAFEVYFDQSIAPGGFAWLVPISESKAYLGLLARTQAKLRLQNLLNKLHCQGRIASQDVRIQQKAVPLGTLPRTYGDRVLVVGDAAGHVKPTTGGGIYFGHLGAQIAVAVLDEALRSNNLTAGHLSRYQKEWQARMGKELSRGYWARQVYARLSDHQIEQLFRVLDSTGLADVLVRADGFSFDWHSNLVLSLLRRSSVYPLLRIKRFFRCEARL